MLIIILTLLKLERCSSTQQMIIYQTGIDNPEGIKVLSTGDTVIVNSTGGYRLYYRQGKNRFLTDQGHKILPIFMATTYHAFSDFISADPSGVVKFYLSVIAQMGDDYYTGANISAIATRKINN